MNRNVRKSVLTDDAPYESFDTYTDAAAHYRRRQGSAVAVGLFAVIYVCTLVWTAHLGVTADDYARHSLEKEAAVIQSAVK